MMVKLIEDYVTGSYKITNLVNGKVYVGGAYVSLGRRIRAHLKDLKGNKHCNRHLQQAWNLYGSKCFRFSILERCAPNDVQACEQKWIDSYQAANPNQGYNICPIAGSALGVKRSEETKTKMKAASLICQSRPETKAKISQSNKGKVVSEATKIKLREITRLQFSSTEARKRASELQIGKVMSKETKIKIANALKGKKKSADHIAKVAAALTGRKSSEATKEKLRKSHLKENLSASARMNMSIAAGARAATPAGRIPLQKAARKSNARF